MLDAPHLEALVVVLNTEGSRIADGPGERGLGLQDCVILEGLLTQVCVFRRHPLKSAAAAKLFRYVLIADRCRGPACGAIAAKGQRAVDLTSHRAKRQR